MPSRAPEAPPPARARPAGGPFENGFGLGVRYYAFKSGAWLAERLPGRLTEGAADLGGRIAYRASVRKREVVTRNMARVVGPSVTGPALDRAVREAYHWYARYWLETFRLGRYQPEQLLAMVEESGTEAIDAVLASGSGLLAVLPHFGFYDLLGAWAGAKGYPLTTVAEVLKPRALFEWFAAIRERAGMTILPAKPGTQALRGLLRALQAGGVAALVADRDLGRRGVWVEYFGEATTAPVGPAMIAARTGAPMAAAAFYQTGPGRFRCEITPVAYARTGDEKADIPVIAQAIASALEDVVRKAPEQYHLFSTNWPADEPGLPPRGRGTEAPPGTEAPVGELPVVSPPLAAGPESQPSAEPPSERPELLSELLSEPPSEPLA